MGHTTSEPTNSVLEAYDLVHEMALGMAGIFSALVEKKLSSVVIVFVVAFGVGCITGIVVRVLSHHLRVTDSERAAIVDSAGRRIALDGGSPSAWLTVASHAIDSGSHDRRAHRKHASPSPGGE